MNASLSTSPGSPANPPAPGFGRVLGGVWRLTFRRFFAPGQWMPVLIGTVALVVITTLVIRTSRPVTYYNWLREFYLGFLVPILAFLSAGGALRDELKAGAVDYLFTRPVRRWVFVAAKFLSHLACIQVFFLLGLAALTGAGAYREIPQLGATFGWLLLGQALTVTAFAALGFLFGILSARFFIFGLIYGGVIEGGIGNIPIQLNRLSVTHQVEEMLLPVLPTFRPVVAALAQQPTPAALGTVATLLAFSIGLVALTALAFSLQELAGARQGET